MSSPFTAVATGIGSWPGIDPRESAAVVTGELPALPHLVELPARGLGTDMIGRSAALLVDLPIDTTPRGYRVTQRPGVLMRRARDYLRADLDALEEAWEVTGRRGTDTVKVQAPSPLTLAAEVELANGHRALTDSGAVRDLADSLTEGLIRHVAEVRRRLDANVVVQLDDPCLTDVLDGTLPGVTGLERVPAVPAPEALAVLDTVVNGVSVPVLLHTCAASPSWELLRRSGVAAVSFDASLLRAKDLDGVGELLDAGKELVLGLVPSVSPAKPPRWRELAESAVHLFDRLGFSRSLLRERAGVAPTCGLASATQAWARTALQQCTEVVQALADDPEAL